MNQTTGDLKYSTEQWIAINAEVEWQYWNGYRLGTKFGFVYGVIAAVVIYFLAKWL